MEQEVDNLDKIGTIQKEEDKPEQERTTVKKKAFISELDKAMGFINVTCTRIGINRQTYYNWRNSDKEFKTRVDFIRSMFVGEAEDKLWELIMEKNTSAIIFYLKNNHPAYKPQLQLSGEVTTVNKYANLSYEQLERQIEELKKLRREDEERGDGVSGSSSDAGKTGE